MKSLFVATLASLSLAAAGQSYVIMDNGIVVTTDTAGFTYDFGHYAYPQKITLKGGQYFVEDGAVLGTVDEKGLLFRKYEQIPEKILGKGINYFLSAEGVAYVVDRAGSVKLVEAEPFRRAVNFGGTFFTVARDPERTALDLYVVTGDGAIRRAELEFKEREIVAFGGTYFMTNRGILYTVARDGALSAKTEPRIGVLQRRGGNYFIDSAGLLFTVAESGAVVVPALPVPLRLASVHRFGSNYFIDQAGRLFVVDKDGNVFEKPMRDHDFRQAKVISL
jgi:hypothetical protein